jgi:uncharacterized protein YegL
VLSYTKPERSKRMTDQNLTEIVAIVDRSGSMETMREDAIGGFNSFLKKQQEEKEGKCLLTYTQFDNEYEVVHNGIDIRDMKPLDETTFVPRGSTALRDAIGRTINTVGERLSKTPEEQRPGNVVVVILTDGQENASREFSPEQISAMVKRQADEYDWAFVYLAQNIDAFATGRNMGMTMSHPNMFLGDAAKGGAGIGASYSVASSAISSRRRKSVKGQSLAFEDFEKARYASDLKEKSEKSEKIE